MSGVIGLGAGGLNLSIATESSDVVGRFISLMRSAAGVECELISSQGQLRRRDTYTVRAAGREAILALMERAGLEFGGGPGVNEAVFQQMTQRDCCKNAFLRGAFLGSGSISHPAKRYHMEFVANLKEFAQPVLNILEEHGIGAGLSARRDAFVVYVKDSGNIAALLAMMGAHASMLEMENIRIVKDIRNQVNRQLNCDTANIDRTVRSSARQAENIRLIAEKTGFENLSRELRQTAELRLAYPEASLSELAELSGGASRSAINHRLRKLNQMADSLKPHKEE